VRYLRDRISKVGSSKLQTVLKKEKIYFRTEELKTIKKELLAKNSIDTNMNN
jgi:hypothetical protein